MTTLPTPLLYIFVITIWGSTWYGIKLQLGIVAPEMSLAYRFILAGCLIFAGLFAKKSITKHSLRHHMMFLGLGVALFSLSYLLAYYAGGLIPSGMNSLLFSTIMLFNIFNAALVFKTPVSWLTVFGACISLFGLSLVFLPEIQSLDPSKATQIWGMVFSIAGAFLGSLGNMISSQLSKEGVGVVEANGYAMIYGGVFSLLIALSLGKPIAFDASLTYSGSLLYLAIFGSVITFGGYMTILKRIGPEKAAMPMVAIPVVALLISELVEGYHWSDQALIGIAFMIIGNLVVAIKGKREFFSRLFHKVKT